MYSKQRSGYTQPDDELSWKMLGFYFVMTAYQACVRVLPAKDGKTDTFFAPDISEVWRGGQKRQSETGSDELRRRASEAAGARLGLIMRTTELCRTRGSHLRLLHGVDAAPQVRTRDPLEAIRLRGATPTASHPPHKPRRHRQLERTPSRREPIFLRGEVRR